MRVLGCSVLGAAVSAACVIIDPNAQLCAFGEEDCACTMGGACDPGLACREGTCVDPDAPATTDASGTEGDTDPSTTDTGAVDSTDDETGDETGIEPHPNYIFVTSTEHTAGALGGLEGADAICQARADAAGLPGTYRAWLSGPGVDARDRFAGARGWVRTDGQPFSSSIDQMLQGKFWFPSTLDENGNFPASWQIWTGTDLDGIGYDHGGGFCGGWTSNDSEIWGLQGDREASRPWWSDSHLRPCNETGRLYCLGADQDFEVEFEPVEGRRVFVTATAIPSGGGLEAADGRCQMEADAAGLQGSFLALLATTTASPASRFDLDGPPWVRIDGVPLFAPGETMGVLAQTTVAFHADGTTSSALTWFGNTSAMLPGGDMSCDDWTSIVGDSTLGIAFHMLWTGWGQGVEDQCAEERPVLCFEE
jgi:hypothetical protein